MESSEIIKHLSEYIHDKYVFDCTNDFNVENIPQLWRNTNHLGELVQAVYVTDTETSEDTLRVHSMYWSKYGERRVSKHGGKAQAGWSVKIDERRKGIPLEVELFFENINYSDLRIHFDTFCNGNVARTTYHIDESGIVSYDDFDGEDKENHKMDETNLPSTNAYFTSGSKSLMNAIGYIAEIIKSRIEYIIEEENLL